MPNKTRKSVKRKILFSAVQLLPQWCPKSVLDGHYLHVLAPYLVHHTWIKWQLISRNTRRRWLDHLNQLRWSTNRAGRRLSRTGCRLSHKWSFSLSVKFSTPQHLAKELMLLFLLFCCSSCRRKQRSARKSRVKMSMLINLQTVTVPCL